MINPRPLLESALNRTGRTLLGFRGLQGLDTYRVHRITGFPRRFAHLGHAPHLPFTVELDRITTIAGFSYHPRGWHPYLATLDEQLEQPGLPYERSTLKRYYDRFQPRTVQDVLLPFSSDPVEPLCSWPPHLELFAHIWGMTPRRLRRILDGPPRHGQRRQELGPQTDEYGRTQLRRVVEAHQSIRTSGFRPQDFRDGALTGYFLVRGETYRFVVMHGNHRLPALRRLGISEVPVRFHRANPPVVNEADLHHWTGRRSSVLTVDAAHAVFDSLMRGTGRERAAALGLTGHHTDASS